MMNERPDLPAIAGGPPAKTKPYGKAVRYGEEELQQLREVIAQGTLFYAQGTKVKLMEERFAAKNGVPYAVACSSGTAAIHAAMIAVGISPGDEVIVSPITDMGSVCPILYQGAVPVFADLDPYSYEMDPRSVESLVTDKTRAVLAVNLWGNACDLGTFRTICDKHNLVLIEDCAQAFGCTYKGRPVGTMGDIGCFSLNEFKHISCGDGGITIATDADLARRLRLSTDKCYSREPGAPRNPSFLAPNYRMTELQGAVAVAQLEKLDEIVIKRRDWAAKLVTGIAGLPGILLPVPTQGCDPSWWFFMVRVNPEKLGASADEFAEAMSAEGVPCSAHYTGVPIYEYPIFRDHSAFARGSHAYQTRQYQHGLCPEAERILDTCVILSVNEAYTDDDLADTVEAFRKVTHWFSTKDKR